MHCLPFIFFFVVVVNFRLLCEINFRLLCESLFLVRNLSGCNSLLFAGGKIQVSYSLSLR